MTFKEFLQSEENSPTDKGMMGYEVQPNHKPSDGQPFKDYLKSTAGCKGNQGGMGGMGGPNRPMMGAPTMGGGMFMRKKMKKR